MSWVPAFARMRDWVKRHVQGDLLTQERGLVVFYLIGESGASRMSR